VFGCVSTDLWEDLNGYILKLSCNCLAVHPISCNLITTCHSHGLLSSPLFHKRLKTVVLDRRFIVSGWYHLR